MKKRDYLKMKITKSRQIRKDKGRLSDLSMDNKKCRQMKLMKRKLERKSAKKALKGEKMEE